MSTLPSPTLSPSWKEEVNRRVADHMHRRNGSAPKTEEIQTSHAASTGRAARAAARVAARYANAPSYNQMLADEARNAIRAAQAAQRAAEDAHAAVQMVLAGLEAASSDSSLVLETESERQPGPMLAPDPQSGPVAVPVSTLSAARPEDDPFSGMQLAPLEPAPSARTSASHAQPEILDQPQPIPANLIEFPREIVATRRLRPRLAEGPLADAEAAPQLSIFEVDPHAVSIQPSASTVVEPAAPAWMTRDTVRPEQTQAQAEILAEPEPEALPVSPVIDLAPVERRILSIVIDGTLSLAAFAGIVRLVAPAASYLHNPHLIEFCAFLAIVLAFAGYQALFASFTKLTPGMWYAGIGLCTLDGYVPERPQRCARLLGLVLSLLPLGLGLAWSMFDEDRLTWHDRLSGTYLRLRQ